MGGKEVLQGAYRQLREDRIELRGVQHARVAQVLELGADGGQGAVDAGFVAHF